jgi:hypothetical protein
MKLKVGDPVIVYKRNWLNGIHKSGRINEIFCLGDNTIYRVYFYDNSDKWVDGCNIFRHLGESIELDTVRLRDTKLKKLGI